MKIRSLVTSLSTRHSSDNESYTRPRTQQSIVINTSEVTSTRRGSLLSTWSRFSRTSKRTMCHGVSRVKREREMERPVGIRDNTRHCRLDREAESILMPSSNDLVCIAAEFNQAIRLESQPTGSIICGYIAPSLSFSLSLSFRVSSPWYSTSYRRIQAAMIYELLRRSSLRQVLHRFSYKYRKRDPLISSIERRSFRRRNSMTRTFVRMLFDRVQSAPFYQTLYFLSFLFLLYFAERQRTCSFNVSHGKEGKISTPGKI